MHVIARMNVGGPAVEITQLMRGLDPEVITQRLVTGYCRDDEADYLETQALDISAARIDGLGRSIRPTDDVKALAKLTRMIRISRPDIVHTHTAKAGVLGRIAAKVAGTGAKIVHTHHGHLLQGYFGPIKTRAVIQLERQLAGISDGLVAVADSIRDDLLLVGAGTPEKFSVIRSGVELGPLPTRETARRQLGVPEGQVVVTMLGRLTKIKRPDRFADVVEILTQRGLRAHFLVVGSGDLRSELEDTIQLRSLPVRVVGWRHDVEMVLAATDIMVLTSDNEGVPLSLMQAGLCSIPVVATDVGGVSELILHDYTGLLVPPNALPLAEALEFLAERPEVRDAFGRRAKVWVQEQFGLDQFIRNHQAMYQRMAHA